MKTTVAFGRQCRFWGALAQDHSFLIADVEMYQDEGQPEALFNVYICRYEKGYEFVQALTASQVEALLAEAHP